MELNISNFEQLKAGHVWVSNNRIFKLDEDSMIKLHYLQSLICPDEELIDGENYCYCFRNYHDGTIHWYSMFGKFEYEKHLNIFFINRCEKCKEPLEVGFRGEIRDCRFCK